MRLLKYVIGGLAVGLMLSACGAPGSAQGFIREHIRCPAVNYGSPQWTSDGSRIIYTIHETFSVDLHEMNDRGKEDRLLARNAESPQLSPDGSMVLFVRQSTITQHARDYHVLDLDTLQDRRMITVGADARWSPDSQWIVYAEPPQASGPIRKVNVATGKEVPLTDTAANNSYVDWYPIWSPDGEYIAFASNYEGAWSIYVMTADPGPGASPSAGASGSDITRLDAPDPQKCPTNGSDMPVSWLPDGDTLLYRRICGGQETLRLASREGEDLGEWSTSSLEPWWVEWSPDGTQALVPTSLNSVPGISIIDADGSNLRLLTSPGGSPRWSPDGKRVVFVAGDAAGNPDIYVINADGTDLTQLTQNPGAGQICLR